jgi:hypothetical protein
MVREKAQQKICQGTVAIDLHHQASGGRDADTDVQAAWLRDSGMRWDGWKADDDYTEFKIQDARRRRTQLGSNGSTGLHLHSVQSSPVGSLCRWWGDHADSGGQTDNREKSLGFVVWPDWKGSELANQRMYTNREKPPTNIHAWWCIVCRLAAGRAAWWCRNSRPKLGSEAVMTHIRVRQWAVTSVHCDRRKAFKGDRAASFTSLQSLPGSRRSYPTLAAACVVHRPSTHSKLTGLQRAGRAFWASAAGRPPGFPGSSWWVNEGPSVSLFPNILVFDWRSHHRSKLACFLFVLHARFSTQWIRNGWIRNYLSFHISSLQSRKRCAIITVLHVGSKHRVCRATSAI